MILYIHIYYIYIYSIMTEQEHFALMEVSQVRGYTVYLRYVNGNFLMMNLGKAYPCDLVSLSLQDLIIALVVVINQALMNMLIIF